MTEAEDLARCTVKALRDMCKKNKWRGYSKHAKAGLIRHIVQSMRREDAAARVLQAQWLRWRARPKAVVNHEDVFTLEPFSDKEKIFTIRSGDCVYQFTSDSLLRYFLASGNFSNPLTRKPLSDRDLRRLRKHYFENYSAPLVFEQRRGNSIRITRHTDMQRLKARVSRIRREESEHERVRTHLLQAAESTVDVIIEISRELPQQTDDGDIIVQVLHSLLSFHLPNYMQIVHDVVRCAGAADGKACMTAACMRLHAEEKKSGKTAAKMMRTVRQMLARRQASLFPSHAVPSEPSSSHPRFAVQMLANMTQSIDPRVLSVVRMMHR